MSRPQGPDPTQPWQPNQADDQQATGGEQTVQASPWQQSGADQQRWQAPAYNPSEYPQYQQPTTPYYPPSQQFPQPPGYPQQPGQYGAPPYGQQPGQPGPYPQQPGPYGPYPQQPGPYGPPPGRSKRSLAVIGTVIGTLAAIVLAVVLVMGFWAPGFFVTTKLDINKAQRGVQQILTDGTTGYGAKNVKDVKCNDGQNPTVKKGGTFTCDVSIDGTKRHVTVTFQDNKGTYEVGRPQ
jgi:hypothetical protein